APGKVAVVIAKDADRRGIPRRTKKRGQVQARCDIPAVSGRNICGIKRCQKRGKPVVWEPRVGIAKDVDVGSSGPVYRIGEVVNLLALISRTACKKDGLLQLAQPGASTIV